ncbi:MAG: Undecaprenyl-diphosphatase [Pelotomaculum thermopropionicum]|uniref:Undecaprenyl-diphosphatase n=1 Tax=Pelotomaculum thermopropionicum TaxID=110500 RepID=A0A117M4D2_9FIRM|nr:MAG: Undecaprenyl-diphosphatase [Pelotomaculum thermopropionicum]
MTVFQAILLGVVQGLGEFLPISSSAHLVLVPWAMGWPYSGLTFDVALHVGTLVSVVAFFWRDWLKIIVNAVRQGFKSEGLLFWYILVATIPGAAIGYFFEEQAETVFRTPFLIGIMLIVMGIILYLVDIKANTKRDIRGLSLADSLLVGLSQAFAIIPGVSRSGATMTAARALGFNRKEAARFSFLLSTPIIVGAGLYKIKDVAPGDINVAFMTGVASSAVVGFIAIAFLLKYVAERSFGVFAWYRIVLGLSVIVLSLSRGF